jgi:hypothetical protein
MAFFSDGKNEYFSFNLDPAKTENCYLFPLNKSQSLVSLYILPVCMIISALIFMGVLAITFLEAMGVNGRYLSPDEQDLLLVILAGVTTLVAGIEIAFFIWMKLSGKPLSYPARQQLRPLQLLRVKSRTAYLSFLLSMLIPVIALGGLPGGFGASASGLLAEDGAFLFFLLQVGLAIGALSIFLVRRVIVLGPASES